MQLGLNDTKYKIVGEETISVSNSAVGLSTDISTTGNNVSAVIISFKDQPVRCKFAGGTPTASDGFTLRDGDVIALTSRKEIRDFLAIRESSDAEIDVLYLVGLPA